MALALNLHPAIAIHFTVLEMMELYDVELVLYRRISNFFYNSQVRQVFQKMLNTLAIMEKLPALIFILLIVKWVISFSLLLLIGQ